MGEILSNKSIDLLRSYIQEGSLSDRGDGPAIDLVRQTLELVRGKQKWIKLPSGRSFRINTNPSAETASMLPADQEAVLEVRDPAIEDWLRVRQATEPETLPENWRS